MSHTHCTRSAICTHGWTTRFSRLPYRLDFWLDVSMLMMTDFAITRMVGCICRQNVQKSETHKQCAHAVYNLYQIWYNLIIFDIIYDMHICVHMCTVIYASDLSVATPTRTSCVRRFYIIFQSFPHPHCGAKSRIWSWTPPRRCGLELGTIRVMQNSSRHGGLEGRGAKAMTLLLLGWET